MYVSLLHIVICGYGHTVKDLVDRICLVGLLTKLLETKFWLSRQILHNTETYVYTMLNNIKHRTYVHILHTYYGNLVIHY